MQESISIVLAILFLALALSCVIGFVKILSRGSAEFDIIARSSFNLWNYFTADIKKPTRASTSITTEGLSSEVKNGQFYASSTRTISSETI